MQVNNLIKARLPTGIYTFYKQFPFVPAYFNLQSNQNKSRRQNKQEIHWYIISKNHDLLKDGCSYMDKLYRLVSFSLAHKFPCIQTIGGQAGRQADSQLKL